MRGDRDHLFWGSDILMVGSSVVSLLCCVWLVARSLPRIPARYKNRLLLRQLWHLAVADILMSLGGFALNAAQLSGIPPSRGVQTCRILEDYVYTLTNGLGLFTSILAETHIALGFVCGLYRCTAAFRRLERTLPAVWLLGLLLSALDSLTSVVHFDAGTGSCRAEFKFNVKVMRPVQVVTVLITTLLMCAGYFALACCSGRAAAPQSVERRVWRSGVRFVLVFLATWGPWLLSGHFTHASWALASAGFWAYLSGICLGLNGALNCLIYANFSRHVRQMRELHGHAEPPARGRASFDPARGGGSFHVAFAGESVQELEARPPSIRRESGEREALEDHPAYWESYTASSFSASSRGSSLQNVSMDREVSPFAVVDARS